MKYETTDMYILPVKFKGVTHRVKCRVIPYNAEVSTKHKNDISWSHGFTHYEDADTGRSLGFCGIQWFEDNAMEIKL